MKTQWTRLIGAVVCAAWAAGCATAPPPFAATKVSEQPRAATLSVDARDYNEVARRLYDSLAQSHKVQKGKTVSLGPVAAAFDGPYSFDARKLQEKLQVLAQRGGILQFSFAVDSMTEESPALERYRIMQLQWEKENTVRPQDLQTFGRLAAIDYLLFGRLASSTAARPGKTEVTYTYNWKMGDCETGLIVWTDETEVTKSGR